MAKKKITQNELRKLMSEQKKKLTVGNKKIESPLAKYDATGELRCILCDHVVKSEMVWTVHINSKKHRENVAQKAKRKEAPQIEVEIPFKKPTLPESHSKPIKLKSILKNKHDVQELPDNFFDLHNRPIGGSSSAESRTDVLEDNNIEPEFLDDADGDQLPEGFFDDPKLDAKVRKVEYKDPIEEEWEQFQKEIKEETSKAQQIISEDQDEATNERQIEEIDEQLRHWTRVVNLEQKKKEAVTTIEEVKIENDNEDDYINEDNFDEFVDWRSKSSFH